MKTRELFVSKDIPAFPEVPPIFVKSEAYQNSVMQIFVTGVPYWTHWGEGWALDSHERINLPYFLPT